MAYHDILRNINAHNKDYHYIYIYISILLLSSCSLWNCINESDNEVIIYGSIVIVFVFVFGAISRYMQLNYKYKIKIYNYIPIQ